MEVPVRSQNSIGIQNQQVPRLGPRRLNDITSIHTADRFLATHKGFSKPWMDRFIAWGVSFHDLLNPARIIGMGEAWILQPEDPWKITGYVHNEVFTCGAVPEPDGTVKIYWGGADTVMSAT
jgi:predicted GH43/DUF377 family glycosyl hydrolase